MKILDSITGSWFQVVDIVNQECIYLEGSVSCLFTYFLIKTIEKGYINIEQYKPVAIKIYIGIIKNLVHLGAAGKVINSPVCAVVGIDKDIYCDKTFEYYIKEMRHDNDPMAIRSFIMASLLYGSMNKDNEEYLNKKKWRKV